MTTDVLLEPMSSTSDLLTATVKSCLTQIRCDVRKVVECSPDEELVHRLRIGLRHLRTVLRELRADRFGADVALHGIGAFAHRMDDFGEAKRSVAKPAREFLAKRLYKLNRLLARAADPFSKVGSARQHRVRKRFGRRLCLGAFATTLFIPGSVTRYVAKWRDAETDLGRDNDLRSAIPLLIKPSDTPGERFAARWLGGRRRTSARRCQKELRRAIQKTMFWGSGVPVPRT